MRDLISRQAALDACHNYEDGKDAYAYGFIVEERLQALPSAEPEAKEIGYAECASAMLKMWIDNVVTDGEYNHIMDKLNKYWGKVNA